MSLLDHFKPWKLVAEMEVTTTWKGLLFGPDMKREKKHVVVFYEKSPNIRKVRIVGNKNYNISEYIEPVIYKWRDHEGELPAGAIDLRD